ncbi:MAG: hypothetical protein RIC14_05590 [Filomicrobium sp.]
MTTAIVFLAGILVGAYLVDIDLKISARYPLLAMIAKARNYLTKKTNPNVTEPNP